MIQRKNKKIEGGKRVDWAKINRPADCPVITIITSTYNAGEDLPWTINSIKSQKYPYIQWIVVDGASNDGTVKLLEDNSDIIDVWISEPDKGIYDAWNKATKYIKGDWVQFIGAGDELNDPETLSDISKVLCNSYPEHDIVYGRLIFIDKNKRKFIDETGEPWEKLKGKWNNFKPKLPIHPEVYHHFSLFNSSRPFNVSYKIAGDSLFLMQQIRNKDFMHVPLTIIKMTVGGMSMSRFSFITTTLECRRASKELGYYMPPFYVLVEGFKFYLKFVLYIFLPKSESMKLIHFFKKIIQKKE